MQRKVFTLAQISFPGGPKPPFLSSALLLDPLTSAPETLLTASAKTGSQPFIPSLPLTSRLQPPLPLSCGS